MIRSVQVPPLDPANLSDRQVLGQRMTAPFYPTGLW